MSSNTLTSPSESLIVRFFVLFLGCIVILAIPFDLITSGITVTWSHTLLGNINFPYPVIKNFNLRLIFELLFGPYIALWAIQKIKPYYLTNTIIKLLTVIWSVIFIIFGSIGVFSSVLGISLFGISDNLITYFTFVYGFVFLLYVWREDLPSIYLTLSRKTNSLISLLSRRTRNLIVLIPGIGLLVLVPFELFWHEVSIAFLEIFFGSLFVIRSLSQIKPEVDLHRLSMILSTSWSIIFLLIGSLGFISSVFNVPIFGILGTPFTVFFLVFGLVYLLFVWRKNLKDRFSRILTQKAPFLEEYNLPQIVVTLIFLIGIGLTLIIPLEFLASKVSITWQSISFGGLDFSFPTISNLNIRIFLELLSGPLILIWSIRKISIYNFLQKIKEFALWKFAVFAFPLMLILFLRSYLLFFEYGGFGEVGIDILIITLRSSAFIGSIYVLLGVGLSLTYKSLGFANFSHGEFVVYGPYIVVFSLPPFIALLEGFLSNEIFVNIFSGLEPLISGLITILEGFISKALGINLVIIPFLPLLGIILITAFIASAILALIVDFIVFRPLRARKAAPSTLMIASIGVSFVIRVILTDTYTNLSKSLQIVGQPRLYDLHVVIIVLGLVFVIFLDLLITRTKLGKAIRAMADNPNLAQTSGISKGYVVAIVWILGAGFAGMGGVLRFLANTPFYPDKGFLLLLPIFAVVILGGIGSYRGAIVAAYIIGFAESFGAFLISSLRDTTFEQLRMEIPIILGDLSIQTFKIEPSLAGELYQNAIGFIILICVLLIKPTGIFGEDLAKDR
ncbi:hypothetical protein CEE45_11625 [Candidatus Heimdallarchaeota archaeon B3_Heim]|nr:MAG: hypothetical protein CEE45_11625 [Candidatus Heimdallarchaeota archaeon B3_Heim]